MQTSIYLSVYLFIHSFWQSKLTTYTFF